MPSQITQTNSIPTIEDTTIPKITGLLYYIETYGCQMNVADTEIIHTILKDNGFLCTTNKNDADIVLINTCAIRDSAEQRIWGRVAEISTINKKNKDTISTNYSNYDVNTPRGVALNYFRPPKPIIGILGCMAERLKEKILQKHSSVHFVIGPDSYRSLPL